MFPAYVNSLGLKDENGDPLTLDADGEGSLKEYVKRVVMESAQRASDQGVDLSDKPWLIVENGKVQGMDFTAYVKDITRMKTAPAFDALDLESPENDLFGNETTNCRHFTEYSTAHTKAQRVCGSRSCENDESNGIHYGRKSRKSTAFPHPPRRVRPRHLFGDLGNADGKTARGGL